MRHHWDFAFLPPPYSLDMILDSDALLLLSDVLSGLQQPSGTVDDNEIWSFAPSCTEATKRAYGHALLPVPNLFSYCDLLGTHSTYCSLH